jgi:hypothetical protein
MNPEDYIAYDFSNQFYQIPFTIEFKIPDHYNLMKSSEEAFTFLRAELDRDDLCWPSIILFALHHDKNNIWDNNVTFDAVLSYIMTKAIAIGKIQYVLNCYSACSNYINSASFPY